MTRSKRQKRTKTPAKRQLKNSQYVLSKEELEQVVSAAESMRDRCILKLLAQTGIRREELTLVEIADLDLAKRQLHVVEGKGAKDRTLPLTKDLVSDFRIYIDKRKRGPLFLSNRREALSVRTINWITQQAGIAAGVDNPNPRYAGLNPHLFRHSFARMWKKAGLSIESLSHILGHSSVATTYDLYGTESLDDVQENYDRLMNQS